MSAVAKKNRDSGWSTIASDGDWWRLALSRSDGASEGRGGTDSGSQSSSGLHDGLWMELDMDVGKTRSKEKWRLLGSKSD